MPAASVARPLGAVPRPIYGEHLGGYLRRLAIANHLGTPRLLLRTIGLLQVKASSGDDVWNALQSAIGLPSGDVDFLRWQRNGRGLDQTIRLDGHGLRNTFVELKRLRVCIGCLRERGTTFSRFHLHHVTACPTHGTELIDRCLRCRRPFRPDDPCHLWTCRNCGLAIADGEDAIADPGELEMSSVLLGREKRIRSSYPPGFLALDLNGRLAVVERLGSLAATAAADEPIVRFDMTARPVVIAGRRELAEIRSRVEAAHAALSNWPGAYHSLLTGLVDRNPSPPAVTHLQRRLATRAGNLAIRPLVAEVGQPVLFLDEATRTFLRQRFGFEKAYRPAGAATRPFASVIHRATPATLREDEYASVVEAAAGLNGAGSAEVASWIEARAVRLHLLPSGGLAVPRIDVRLVGLALASLPDQDPSEDLEHNVQKLCPVLSPYSRVDLVNDLLDGRVRALVRDRTKTGLSSLAFDPEDIRRRHALAIVGRWLIDDDMKSVGSFNKWTQIIWGDHGKVTPSTVDARRHHRRGAGRVPLIKARDVVGSLQATSGIALFRTIRRSGAADKLRWPDVVISPASAVSNFDSLRSRLPTF